VSRVAGSGGLLEGSFRRAYVANAVSQLGTSLQWVALLWYAVDVGGAFGVIAVRVATTLPALVFGLHGGLIADRWNRRTTVIGANLVAGLAFVPVAVVGIAGGLPLWGLATAGFVSTTANAYFMPAFGSLVPGLVGRSRVQQANALVNATDAVLSVGGLALAAGVLAAVPIGVFFALNAACFLASGLLLALLPPGDRPARAERQPRLREAFTALRVRPGLASGVAMLGAGMAVMTGVWTVGVADLAHSRFGGVSALSLLLLATAVGEIGAGVVLARRPVRRKVFASTLSWLLLFPGYLLLGAAHSIGLALLGTTIVGMTPAVALVLLAAAAQESVPERMLGRVLGVVYLANVGAKPLGLLALGPLYAVFSAETVFAVGGFAALTLSLVAAASVSRATRAAVAVASPTQLP
jgi:hypothetical protein